MTDSELYDQIVSNQKELKKRGRKPKGGRVIPMTVLMDYGKVFKLCSGQYMTEEEAKEVSDRFFDRYLCEASAFMAPSGWYIICTGWLRKDEFEGYRSGSGSYLVEV